MRKIPTLFLTLGSLVFLSACSTGLKKAPMITAERPKPNHLGFSKPVSRGYKVTQRYRPAKNRKHKGVDLADKKGSPIFSVASGRIIYQGRRFSGYGKMIMIAHNNGITSLYSHLNKIFVKAGQRVQRGQLVGAMGRTGRASGVHLHFEIMKNKKVVNPETYIKF